MLVVVVVLLLLFAIAAENCFLHRKKKSVSHKNGLTQLSPHHRHVLLHGYLIIEKKEVRIFFFWCHRFAIRFSSIC